MFDSNEEDKKNEQFRKIYAGFHGNISNGWG